MSGRLDWDTDGRAWPNRAFSRFVRAGGLRWHVQVIGQGGTDERPIVLLLHGTGASTHSWRALAPLLARRCTVVALDLPGHGFTGTSAKAEGFSLPAVASGIADLFRVLDLSPALVAGHSAGAAVAARLCLDGAIAPDALDLDQRRLVAARAGELIYSGLHGGRLPSSRLASWSLRYSAGRQPCIPVDPGST